MSSHSNPRLQVAIVAALGVFTSFDLAAQVRVGEFEVAASVNEVRSLRLLVKLSGGIEHEQPLAIRERGLRPEARAAMHEGDVVERRLRCAQACASLRPALAMLGAEIVHEVPMFHSCIIEARSDRRAAIAALPGVVGVWNDSIARPMGRISPSDPVPSSVEHHRSQLANANGFTAAGSPTWAPVMAILDGWLLGEFGGVQRHHAALRQNGDLAQPTRVLADLDWDTPPTPIPARPLPAPPQTGGAGVARQQLPRSLGRGFRGGCRNQPCRGIRFL